MDVREKAERSMEESRKEYLATRRYMSGLAAIIGGGALFLVAIALFGLNFLSGIVAGIWLAVLGLWSSIIYGFVLSIAMPWVYSIASLPSMGLAFLVSLLFERGSKVFTLILGLLSSLYSNALIAIWVFYVFLFFLGRADESAYIPLLLWGYSTAMAPLSYMASKESPDSTATTMALFFAELSYLLIVVAWFVGASAQEIIVLQLILIVLFSLISITMAAFILRSRTSPSEV